MRNQSIKRKLLTMVVAYAIGLAIFVGFAYDTYSSMGPGYRRVVSAKDLIADIIPPPQYLIEAHLVALQMMNARDSAAALTLLETGKKLRRDFEERGRHWSGTLSDGEMKNVMRSEVYEPGIEYLDLRDHEFIPALVEGDHAKAAALMNGPLADKFDRHREGINRLVVLANRDYENAELEIRSVVTERGSIMIGLALVIAASVLGYSLVIVRNVSSRLGMAAADASTQAAETEHAANDGARAVSDASRGFAAIRDASEESTRRTDELASASGTIGRIVVAIADIAKQTNLIALNSAIEATRAGEQGKGFAVVADEIRRLSERSAKSAAEIGKVVESIQAEIAAVQEAMKKGAAAADQGITRAEHLAANFEKIQEKVTATRNAMAEIAAVIGEPRR